MGLGSNLDDRLSCLRNGIKRLENRGLFLRSASRLFESAPMYVTDQPPFLNAVVEIETSRDPAGLLSVIGEVEEALGRERKQRFGPRTLDLDILMWGRDGRTVIRQPDLVVPHPRMLERAFVLLPLADVAGELIHPAVGLSIGELAASLDLSGVEVVAGANWYPTP